jgi:hypothetical protein
MLGTRKVIVSGLVNPFEDDLGTTTTLFSENLIWACPDKFLTGRQMPY